MSAEIIVKAADTKALKKAFINFPSRIYKDDPNWARPLNGDMRMMLDIPNFIDKITLGKRHPFYDYGEIRFFLAYKNGELAGRIAAIKNPLYEEHNDNITGFWGFFECINDQEVANILFQTAAAWLISKGFKRMSGPASPSSTYDYGLLVDGFDDSPRIMMTYNPKYYIDLIENAGLEKAKQLYAYKMTAEGVLADERLRRVVGLIEKRYQVEIKPIRMDKQGLKEDVEKIKEVYNKAWDPNWGHVPFTPKEIEAVADGIRPVADPELILFCYVRGELAGMAVAVRDINLITKDFGGRMLPFNIFKVLNKKNREKIEWMRVILLGVLPKFQGKGIDAVFYWTLIQNSLKLGLKYGEASWILEDNEMMNRGMQNVGGEIYKRYNIYEKTIKE